jgi:hypothetical protein
MKKISISCQAENVLLLNKCSDPWNYLTKFASFSNGIPKASNAEPIQSVRDMRRYRRDRAATSPPPL